jgi:hypothetical protein
MVHALRGWRFEEIVHGGAGHVGLACFLADTSLAVRLDAVTNAAAASGVVRTTWLAVADDFVNGRLRFLPSAPLYLLDLQPEPLDVRLRPSQLHYHTGNAMLSASGLMSRTMAAAMKM